LGKAFSIEAAEKKVRAFEERIRGGNGGGFFLTYPEGAVFLPGKR
jgi:hypothetical protein